jgi:hypothetical protein
MFGLFREKPSTDEERDSSLEFDLYKRKFIYPGIDNVVLDACRSRIRLAQPQLGLDAYIFSFSDQPAGGQTDDHVIIGMPVPPRLSTWRNTPLRHDDALVLEQ